MAVLLVPMSATADTKGHYTELPLEPDEICLRTHGYKFDVVLLWVIQRSKAHGVDR